MVIKPSVLSKQKKSENINKIYCKTNSQWIPITNQEKTGAKKKDKHFALNKGKTERIFCHLLCLVRFGQTRLLTVTIMSYLKSVIVVLVLKD